MPIATPASVGLRPGACRGDSRRAFSLVELLVVIGIVSVLLSLLLPSLNRAREQARQMSCASNLRQIGLAFVMYVNDNKGHFPTAAPRAPAPQLPYDWLFWEASGPRQRDLNDSAVAPYLGQPVDKNVLRCPSDNTDQHFRFFDPPYQYSYVFNRMIHSLYQDPPYAPAPQDVVSTRIVHPSEKIMLIEEDERGIGDGWWEPTPGTVDWLAIRHDSQRLPEGYSVSSPDAPQGVVNPENPGNLDRRGNAAFCDGHCEFTTRRTCEDPTHYDPLK